MIMSTMSKIAPIEIALGARMRALRQSRSVSLAALAKACGKSVGYVSQVERGLSSPTLKEVALFAEVLGTDMLSLFVDQPSDKSKSPVRLNKDRSFIAFRGEGTLKRVLTPNNDGALRIYVMHVGPFGSSGDALYTHDGEEAGFVLKGGILLTVGDAEYQLKAGDSFRFSSQIPHAFRNVGKVPAEIVWVNLPQ